MKNVLVVGVGRFGRHIVMKLNELGHDVMAIDVNEDRINSVLPYVTNAQIGDCTNPEFLSSLGVDDYDLCFVTIGDNFQNSLEATSLLKEFGAKRVVSRAARGVHAKFLSRNGADDVLYLEKELASWAAIRYTADHILDYIEVDDTYAIFEVSIPDKWWGKTVIEIDIRKKHNINILAVKSSGKINMSVTPNTILTQDKTLLVWGSHKDIQKCFRL